MDSIVPWKFFLIFQLTPLSSMVSRSDHFVAQSPVWKFKLTSLRLKEAKIYFEFFPFFTSCRNSLSAHEILGHSGYDPAFHGFRVVCLVLWLGVTDSRLLWQRYKPEITSKHTASILITKSISWWKMLQPKCLNTVKTLTGSKYIFKYKKKQENLSSVEQVWKILNSLCRKLGTN